MTDRDPSDDYYRAIEEEFVRRRGAPMLLSPRDWALIGEWRQTGVPLRIALQGIANIFDAHERRGPSARRINSLSYCRQEVLGLHEVYLGLRGVEAGRPGTDRPSPDTGGAVSRYLGRLAKRVREAMAFCSAEHLDPLVAALALTAAELKRLRKESRSATSAPQHMEEALRRLDGDLHEAARRSLPGTEMRQAEKATDGELGEARARMAPEAYAATRRASIERWIRLRCRLPRLTLFDSSLTLDGRRQPALASPARLESRRARLAGAFSSLRLPFGIACPPRRLRLRGRDCPVGRCNEGGRHPAPACRRVAAPRRSAPGPPSAVAPGLRTGDRMAPCRAVGRAPASLRMEGRGVRRR